MVHDGDLVAFSDGDVAAVVNRLNNVLLLLYYPVKVLKYGLEHAFISEFLQEFCLFESIMVLFLET